ncbi:MAG: diphthine--ammonia ligase [Candidatus Woesearchaeota archaeon]
MCAILGIFHSNQTKEFIENGLTLLKNRGMDGFGVATSKQVTSNKIPSLENQPHAIAHRLHSVVSHVLQPLHKQTSFFVANCEIYNWKELATIHNVHADNDAGLLFELVRESKPLEHINGVYAFCHWSENTVTLARDILGEKPLFYYYDGKTFAFASEKKALKQLNPAYIRELYPRHILKYTIQTNTLEKILRPFFQIPEHTSDTQKRKQETIAHLLKEAIHVRIPQKPFGLLFSGGIDSVYIAYVLKQLGYTVPCYIASVGEESSDLLMARKAREELGLDVRECIITQEQVHEYVKKVVPIIESSNVVKVGVALPFFVCCEQAKKDGIKVLFSGLGSEELFAGYQRHENSTNINQECVSGLQKMYERDLYRDDVITMYHSIELRLPFLDTKLIEYALSIPGEDKIDGDIKKKILRDTAKHIGIPDQFAYRPKKAAQYGSRFDKALQKLAKKHGFSSRSAYLHTFFPPQNQCLAVLFSSGKDSVYAMHIMAKQQYPIVCLLTIKSTNQDSYMFHTPAIDITKLQAKALDIPIEYQETTGEKEAELEDLQELIKRAIDTYNIDGIVTGALYSTYQRNRIDTIAQNLGIQVYSPLWHINQKEEVNSIINQGFEVILTKIAADGLDKTWLATPLTHKHLASLEQLEKTLGLNIAGEGGEYESLVLDAPMFKEKIIIDEFLIDEQSQNCASITIKKAHLQKKPL